MIRKLTLSLAAAAAILAAGCASTMPADPAKKADGVLVGANDMALYIFDKDMAGSGKSVCNGHCAQNWPPLAAAAGAAASGEWAVITRDDGSRQWAYKGSRPGCSADAPPMRFGLIHVVDTLSAFEATVLSHSLDNVTVTVWRR